MSNWRAITITDLYAVCRSEIIDTANAQSIEGSNPVAEAIADITALIRRKCNSGNQLDQNAAHIPNSLVRPASKLCAFQLQKRVPKPLSRDDEVEEERIYTELNRISDKREQFEQPDNPAGTAEMQTVVTPYVVPKRRHYSWWQEDGS